MDVGTATSYILLKVPEFLPLELLFLASRHYSHDPRRHPFRVEGCTGKADRRILLPDPHHLGASRIHVWNLVSHLGLQIWLEVADSQTSGLAGGKRIVCGYCYWDLLLGYFVDPTC